MGYTDISILGSDYAADMAYEIAKNIIQILNEEIKNEANEYNTCGIVNVALFFEEVIIKVKPVFLYDDELVILAKKIIEGLDALIKGSKEHDGTDWDGKDYHIKRYSELRKKIKKWIKDNG